MWTYVHTVDIQSGEILKKTKDKTENGVGLKNKSKNPITPLQSNKDQTTHVF